MKGVDFASELSQKMMDHAAEFEKLYGELKKVVSEDTPSDSAIEKLLDDFTRLSKANESAKVGCW